MCLERNNIHGYSKYPILLFGDYICKDIISLFECKLILNKVPICVAYQIGFATPHMETWMLLPNVIIHGL